MKENDKAEEAEHTAVKESSDSEPQRTGLHDWNQRRNAVLHKVLQALQFAKAAYGSRNAASLVPASGTMRLQGLPDTWVDIAWQETDSVAYLAFRGPLLKDYKGMRGSAQTPQYLKGISSNARAEAAVLWRFEALQEHSGNIAGIRGAVMNLSGGTAPRRVVCTGYCVGGGLAGVAAPWAAITWPGADVRCITFGSAVVANQDFAHVFSWLVAAKYTVYHSGDALASSCTTATAMPLGHIIHISHNRADTADIKGIEKQNSYHMLAAYEEALTSPHQGPISHIPFNTEGLQGISKKSNHKHLTDLWHANKKRKDEAHAKQQPPVGAAANEQEGSIDNFSGCAERESGFIAANGHDGDTSADRPTSMNAQVALVIGWFQGAAAAASTSDDANNSAVQHTAAAETAYSTQHMYLAQRVRGSALAAHGVYHSLEYFKGVTGLRTSELLVCKKTETYCAVGWIPSGTLIIAFRGTANLTNVKADINFFSKRVELLPEAFPGAKAHSGFLQQLSSITNPESCDSCLEGTIKTLTAGQQPNRIICCGHSLGGAVAALVASRFDPSAHILFQ
ncbi:hypothetical protein WJX75_004012 [Coccomyxa subellipsoidea]|uniref:Fungal lipase-type domain-containing protein n=1 Tax=Coccomyxa subellipsoidea TaxID=248742 RepID=A0ABR2Z3D1_9CHLO